MAPPRAVAEISWLLLFIVHRTSLCLLQSGTIRVLLRDLLANLGKSPDQLQLLPLSDDSFLVLARKYMDEAPFKKESSEEMVMMAPPRAVAEISWLLLFIVHRTSLCLLQSGTIRVLLRDLLANLGKSPDQLQLESQQEKNKSVKMVSVFNSYVISTQRGSHYPK